ncbi:glycosyltransferase family 2 protein [Candidatus Parcubacteria bacterium]|nr:MAG: glycosyltransferase family 2 protein [Candidatus Parcubacteria bacterium]
MPIAFFFIFIYDIENIYGTELGNSQSNQSDIYKLFLTCIMVKTVKVSVLMSVHNAQAYLCDAVDSILNQTFNDFEFIIIDDGSTDHTLKLIQAYANKDFRIKIHKNQENYGLTRSLNLGLKLCEGKYIARMDADDFSDPSRLQKQVNYLDQNPEISLVSVGRWYIAPNGLIYDIKVYPDNHKYLCKLLLKGINVLDHGCIMIRKDIIMKFDEPYRFFYSQDFDLWLRLMEQHEKFGMIQEPLHYRRRNIYSVSSSLQGKRKQISNLIVELNYLRKSNQPEGDWKSKELAIISEPLKNSSSTYYRHFFYNGKAFFFNKAFDRARSEFFVLLKHHPKVLIYWIYMLLSCMGTPGYSIWKLISICKNKQQNRILF